VQTILTTEDKAAKPNLRQKALEYLAKREYSAQELQKKLLQLAQRHQHKSRLQQREDEFAGDESAVDIDETLSAETHAEIAQIIADFQQKNWLSDQRFTEQIVHARQSKFGTMKIAQELKQKGVSDTLISDAVQTLKQSELENARAVWRKKFKHAPSDRNEWAKQARFLQSRGYSFEIIKKVISDSNEEWIASESLGSRFY